jgi:3,4-dihydroxy 2-butanone 4-phosphate synthase/GTP cyclohydrolase II
MGSIEQLIRHRLATEHTVQRVEQRDIDTPWGAFALHVYRDRLSHDLHFALVRGTIEPATPTLVCVHVKNLLSDVLHWQRADFGVPVTEALAAIAAVGSGVVVVLSEPQPADALLARLQPPAADSPTSNVTEWRRNGAGAQILVDLGCGKLRVLGTPRRQVGLAGFGLEVVEYVHAASALPAASP